MRAVADVDGPVRFFQDGGAAVVVARQVVQAVDDRDSLAGAVADGVRHRGGAGGGVLAGVVVPGLPERFASDAPAGDQLDGLLGGDRLPVPSGPTSRSRTSPAVVVMSVGAARAGA